jgi:hypothetical protein
MFSTLLKYNYYVRFKVFTAVNMKSSVFWDVTPLCSCNNRLGISSQRVSVVSVFSSSPILVTLMNEAFLRNVGSYKSHTA